MCVGGGGGKGGGRTEAVDHNCLLLVVLCLHFVWLV